KGKYILLLQNFRNGPVITMASPLFSILLLTLFVVSITGRRISNPGFSPGSSGCMSTIFTLFFFCKFFNQFALSWGQTPAMKYLTVRHLSSQHSIQLEDRNYNIYKKLPMIP